MNAEIVQDPVFLIVFLVLGCKKLFSSSPNSLGSVVLLVALSCASSSLARLGLEQTRDYTAIDPTKPVNPIEPAKPLKPEATEPDLPEHAEGECSDSDGPDTSDVQGESIHDAHSHSLVHEALELLQSAYASMNDFPVAGAREAALRAARRVFA